MPTRNIVKVYGEGQYYHVYNRGVNKTDIFIDDADYRYFLTLLKQRLGSEIGRDIQRRRIANFSDEVALIAYCLMPNHYHMLLYLKERPGIERLMRSVMTAYSGYFNRRYNRVGALFQNHFLASRVSTDTYLWHVSRYIHLNATDVNYDWAEYPYSSARYFLGQAHADWIHPEMLVDTGSSGQYQTFVDDGVQDHELFHKIRHELANG